ncbi:NAD-dependent succinate-semialdehyde dehydrogenase [Pseudoclavibacter sp. 13-3]|uniref:NAD-dependent succinate-semialdehyde dehydrogenase n=1 Tax=Pseudoclavibacter sp. 13-3 TaxID=2901228 RepID=UPI001E5105A7|nr:NAD-dependent succinate-semialdehyde dehydrogenase [Pseudoclavibacter sp. 13-3]MCD7101343.1 NAD-dependent succinate-semialdehyde dehydrogenase [Pseudoclavibacter sp. 13-3]
MSHYAVVNPSTGETVAEYPTATDEQIAAAIDQVAQTHRTWSGLPVAERAERIRRVAQLHRERRDDLAAIATREMGKSLDQSLGEVDFSADIFEYYADHAEEFLADEHIVPAKPGTALIRKSSYGPLLGIMPWNFPYYQVARFAGPNLIIGNTVLLKHAPQCPESALAIERIFIDAGVEGAYVNIFATNEQISTVIADPRVRGISLTGSERAGAAVAAQAGQHLKKVVLELGGSDPFILLSTDDMESTVAAAFDARMGNNGQACNAAKRFLVVDGLYDEFLRRFTEALAAVHAQNTDAAPDIALGPLSSELAAERLSEQVWRAVEQGATVALGGAEHHGAYFEPTVLTDITPDNDAYREEFFGPVAQVYRVADEDEAVRIANDTPFGLGSYVFTTDRAQAVRIADRLEAGMVYINEVDADSAELPFGGVKNSGSGRELGALGIQEFVNKKLIRSGDTDLLG